MLSCLTLNARNLLRKIGRGAERFHHDQRGDMIQDILKIAVIALPILGIIYFVFCMMCERMMTVLEAIGVTVTLDTLGKICIVGACAS